MSEVPCSERPESRLRFQLPLCKILSLLCSKRLKLKHRLGGGSPPWAAESRPVCGDCLQDKEGI